MISGVVYLLRIFKLFHRLMNNPVFVKKNFFSFPVAVNNSIKLGPLVFLL